MFSKNYKVVQSSMYWLYYVEPNKPFYITKSRVTDENTNHIECSHNSCTLRISSSSSVFKVLYYIYKLFVLYIYIYILFLLQKHSILGCVPILFHNISFNDQYCNYVLKVSLNFPSYPLSHIPSTMVSWSLYILCYLLRHKPLYSVTYTMHYHFQNIMLLCNWIQLIL